MGYSFLDFMKKIGIFIVCAQSFMHFAAGKSYEKYIKLLIGVMILAQFAVPIRSFLSGDGEEKIYGQVEAFQKEINELLEQEMETPISVANDSYGDEPGTVELLEREMREKLSEEAEKYGCRVREVTVCEEEPLLLIAVTKEAECAEKIRVEKIEKIKTADMEENETQKEETAWAAEKMKERFGIVLGIDPSYIEIREE